MSTQVATVPVSEMERIADDVVKSGLFGFKTNAQAMAIMALCTADGIHPATAIRDYHVIQGRPAMKADAMLARFQKAGGVVNWVEYTDTKVAGEFSHPQSSPHPVRVEWTIEQAKRIGLAGKDNWKNYPRAMLRARVISEGVRTVYPGIAVGVYTVEEVRDMPAQAVRDMGAAEVVTEVNVAERTRQIIGTQSRDDLQHLWQEISGECAKANDREAYATLKAAVSDRLKVLPEAEAA